MTALAVVLVAAIVVAAVIWTSLLGIKPPCAHRRQQCRHGDALNHHPARAVCLDCGKLLKDLPAVCNYSGRPHPSTQDN